MNNIFTGSKELNLVFEQYGWNLYDVTIPPDRVRPLSWNEIEKNGPVQEYEFSRQYKLLPVARDEKLRDAFSKSINQGIHPVLKISPKFSRTGVTASDPYKWGHADNYFVNDLYFSREKVLAFANPLITAPYSSSVEMSLNRAVYLFSNCFTLLQFSNGKVSQIKPLEEFLN